MSKAVEKANLPVNCDKIVIGEKYADILDNSLKSLNILPIYVPNNLSVDERLSGHADLSVFHPGGTDIFLAPYLKNTVFSKRLTESGFKNHFLDVKQGKKYPLDAALNGCAFGNTIIYCNNSTSPDIVNFFAKTGERLLITAKQGYSRCSICIVDENSIITADRGIYKAAVASGKDALLVTQGYVELPGYQYGFLGGASFKISESKLCFTGLLDSHPDKINILNFLKEKNVEPLYLTNLPIFDIGGAVPIMEK